jgi:hypothetical protein
VVFVVVGDEADKVIAVDDAAAEEAVYRWVSWDLLGWVGKDSTHVM